MDKKGPSKYSLSDFWVFWWKFNKLIVPFLKPQVRVYLNFAALISIMTYNSCVFFNSSLIYFGQKEATEVQIFRLLKCQEKLWILNWALKILLILILMSSFPDKYIMFELKKYRGVMFIDTKEWCKILTKTDLWFDQEF